MMLTIIRFIWEHAGVLLILAIVAAVMSFLARRSETDLTTPVHELPQAAPPQESDSDDDDDIPIQMMQVVTRQMMDTVNRQ